MGMLGGDGLGRARHDLQFSERYAALRSTTLLMPSEDLPMKTPSHMSLLKTAVGHIEVTRHRCDGTHTANSESLLESLSAANGSNTMIG